MRVILVLMLQLVFAGCADPSEDDRFPAEVRFYWRDGSGVVMEHGEGPCFSLSDYVFQVREKPFEGQFETVAVEHDGAFCVTDQVVLAPQHCATIRAHRISDGKLIVTVNLCGDAGNVEWG